MTLRHHQLLNLDGFTTFINQAEFSPDGSVIATVREGGKVRLRDARTAALLRDVPGHKGTIQGFAFRRDGSRLVTAGTDHTAIVWEVQTGKRLHTLSGHTGPVTSAVF